MTGELLALLRRVEAADGPVELGRGRDTGVVTLRLPYEGESSWGDSDRFHWSHWDAPHDALLIHALRHDAFRRYVFKHEVSDFTPVGAGYHVRFQPSVGRGGHQHEACAWLLAWLDAFEEPT